MSQAPDPVALSQELIRCPSVTPEEGGAISLLEERLGGLGFTCHRLVFEDRDTPPIENLYARMGTEGPNLCFAGHTDVVPVGDARAWSVEPFAGKIRDGWLIGRGVVDMKAAIACFVTAAAKVIERPTGWQGSLSLLITGDEEGPAINGTRKVLDWLKDRGERLDACIVGEPTSEARLGDTIKIGRRGSLNGRLSIQGVQGHVAYPQHADNPLHPLVRALGSLIDEPLDRGNAHFEPSSLQITSIDVGNPASNVIPAAGHATFNVRFNDHYDGARVETWIRERLDRLGHDYQFETRLSGDSFLCPPGPLSDALQGAVREVLGTEAKLGTGGGTSDARFIKDHCTVAELGLSNATAHQVDERAPVSEIKDLSRVYEVAIRRFR